jgi:dTDP-4-dehydrorhamnose reductase
MRCLILGGDGMLGHQLLKSWQIRHDVRVTVRGSLALYQSYDLFHAGNTFDRVDVRDFARVRRIVEEFRPQAVVNAVGIIKQQPAAKEPLPSLEVNAVFPHRLQELCRHLGARMVHISTDCVFNGRRGSYTEQDPADAEDLYGLSKYLGEVAAEPAITLRSSIIGLELSRKKSLVEWFLSQQGTIRGFTRAIYTGLTTLEMARVIEAVITARRDLCGVWQVASEPITKYELLCQLAAALGHDDLVIVPDDQFACDRSLNGQAFSQATGYRPPAWDEMLAELAAQIQKERYLHVAA